LGAKYSTNSASGYNSTPPADDGSVSEANKVKWSTIKTKLADPTKTLAEAIDADLVTHFDQGPTALTSNTTLGASHFNQFIQVSGSGVTLSLTDAATLGAGWNCWIFNTDTNTTTISRATGGDTINGSAANYTLPARSGIRVVVNAAATGFEIRSYLNPLGDNTITSTDAGASAGPNLILDRNSASPAASDALAAIALKGRDSGGGTDTYAQIQAQIIDATATSEDGRLELQTAVAGTLATRVYVQNGIVVGSATGGDQGTGTVNATGVFVNGSSISPTAANGASKVLLASQTASSSSSIAFTSSINSTYPIYVIEWWNVKPSADGAQFQFQTSTNGGSSYGTSYKKAAKIITSGGTDSSSTSAADTVITVASSGIGNAAEESCDGQLTFTNPTSSSLYKHIRFNSSYIKEDGVLYSEVGAALQVSTSDIDAVRFVMSTGTISSGEFRLYGIKGA
jgi:hypothetical protein